MRTRALTIAGLAVLACAPILLLLTGHTSITTSADDEAAAVPLAGIVVPYLVGLILIRLVPPDLPVLEIAGGDEREAPRRQARWLTVVALLFTALAVVVRAAGLQDLYPLLKVLVLLGGGWLVLWRIRGGRRPGRAHRQRIPRRWHWLGPVPVILVWGYLFFYSPLAGDGTDVSGYAGWSRAELAAAAIFSLLTASVLEEWFYRMMLQTRFEALWGRWPAIVAATLLFVAMHTYRLVDGRVFDTAPGLIVSTGGLGLMAGYLWSRYRNPWAVLVVHGATNALILLPLFF